MNPPEPKARVAAPPKAVGAQARSGARRPLPQALTPVIIRQQAAAKRNGMPPAVMGSDGVLPMIGTINPGGQ